VSQEVTVTAAAPVVDTKKVTTGGTFTREMVEFSSPGLGQAGLMLGGAGGGGGRGGGIARPPTRWRVRSATVVERSTDEGVSWEALTIDPPATITAGVAPTPVVCWLAGRGGVVLRLADGQHFERVSLPEPADIKSITAAGALQATVTTVDGRVFVTTDGGATWRLQGFSAASF
jgi:hypothetical protein